MKKYIIRIFLTFIFFLPLHVYAEGEIIIDSANVLQKILQDTDRQIPHALIQKSVAIAVFPSVKQAGFVVGGLYGEGIMVQKISNGSWSSPLSIKITGGSIGYQIGYQASDILFFIMSPSVAKEMLENKVTLGVDTSIAVGPYGKNYVGMTDAQFTKDIYIYSNNRGLFAGVSLGGAYFQVKNEPIIPETEYVMQRWNNALSMLGY